MRRVFAIAAMLALAVPTLAIAQEHEHHGGPHPGGPPGHHQPGPMGGAHGGPHPGPRGPVGAQFSYRGHMVNRLHAAPFVYPHGWAYRHWAVGALLPPLFLAPAYYYSGWAGLGLAPPPPGFRWVRYGPDLLLVNVTTGQVVETVPDAFY